MTEAQVLANPKGWTSLLVFMVISLAALVGFASRLFAVLRFESIIHEFDPWFNYRSTAHMVENGFYKFLNWFDERAWYPLGRIVGGTVYPGLMVTSGLIHYVLNTLNIPVHIREICVFLAPVFSGLTAFATYLLTTELWTEGAGLFAACFISIVPGYISRSVAGSYDNEGIAIFALQFTYFLWVKALKTGSVQWAALCALSYFYMVSAWGGYVFITNLLPIHALLLLIMGRYSLRLYIAYSTWFILGQLMAMQVPFVGFQPVRTSEHMAAAGMFGLLQAVAFFQYLRNYSNIKYLSAVLVVLVAAIGFIAIVTLTYAGYIAPWSGRFFSLYDTGYAKIHIPIIASVSEHQPTTWVSFFFDLHILACTFPVGLWLCVKNVNDERIFIITYAVTAVYFAGVMVRLMLTLTPCVCVLAGIAFSHTFELFLVEENPTANSADKRDDANKTNKDTKNDDDARNRQLYDKASTKPHKGKQLGVSATIRAKGKDKGSDVSGASRDGSNDEETIGSNTRMIISVTLVLLVLMFAMHCTWVTSNAYSSPSIVLASYANDGSRRILDDFREAYYWLQRNTADDARVMSWWDYGYQIAGMANRTTLVDNNTWNNSHIALVGKAMSSNETTAYKIMRELDVDYVLVIFGGFIGYSGDDINKFLWMVRIAEGEHSKEIKESEYFTDNGEFRVDAAGSQRLLNCLMYKMSYYRFGEVQLDYRSPPGFDRTRGVEIGNKNFKLTHIEEAYTTEHWLVRIYRVLKPDNRPSIKYTERQIKNKRRSNFRKSSNLKGSLKSKSHIVKGKAPKHTGKSR